RIMRRRDEACLDREDSASTYLWGVNVSIELKPEWLLGDFTVFEKMGQGAHVGAPYGLCLWRDDFPTKHRPNRFDGWLGFVKHVAMSGVNAVQLVTMIGNGRIWVFKDVTREDADDGFMRLDDARSDQL